MDSKIQTITNVQLQGKSNLTTSPDKLLANFLLKEATNVSSEENTNSENIETINNTGSTTEVDGPVPKPISTQPVEEIDTTSNNSDPFSSSRELFNQINPYDLESSILNNAKSLLNTSSDFYRDQGNYLQLLAPTAANLLSCIQNNDSNGIYNCLQAALNLAADLKIKRAEKTGYKDLIEEAHREKRIYQNILNDPNMINLNNPQHAFQFLTQTMMWTNGGSLPDYMHNLSNTLGTNTIFYDPGDVFKNYDY